jgi:hypothetical protein
MQKAECRSEEEESEKNNKSEIRISKSETIRQNFKYQNEENVKTWPRFALAMPPDGLRGEKHGQGILILVRATLPDSAFGYM